MLSFASDKTKGLFGASSNAPSSRFVALDIDSHTLRIVCADPRRDSPRFKKLVAVDVPDDVDLENAKTTGQFIRDALRAQGLQHHKVLMDVPRSSAVLKSVQLPPVDSEREIPGMVRYQVEKELPFSIDEAVVDFTLEDHQHSGSNGNGNGESSEGRNVLVAAVRNSVVDHYLAIADAAGVKLQQLGLRPYADVRCLEACVASKATQSNVVLVHLTADEAEINVLINGSLAFSRSAPIKTNGDAPPNVPAALAVEVVRSLQSVHAIQHGAKIERVWVAGGTGLEADLASTLSSRLSVPCDQLDAPKALNIKESKVEGATSGGGFITALGLSIGHNAFGMPLDFLHPKKPPIERDIKKIRSMGAVAAAIVLALGCVLFGVMHVSGLNSERNKLVNEYNQLEKDNRPVKKIGKRVKSIESWIDSRNDWLDHWANLSGLFPSAKDVYLTKIQTNPNGTIGLTVKTRSSEVITQLSEQLREAGYGVKLGSESTGTDELGYRYSTSVTLTPGAKMKIDVSEIEQVSRPEDDGSFDIIRRGSSGSSRYRSKGGRR